MNKQEEIKKGIGEVILRLPFYSTPTEQLQELIGLEVCRYLHSQGVVIKVDRELPDTYTSELGEYGAVILENGTYLEVVAVEPLLAPDKPQSKSG